jgi:foldase protein PrsA
MNSSKKVVLNPRQGKKKQDQKINNPNLWIILSVVLVVILIGAVSFDQLYKRVVLTVDGEKYHMDDLSYYIYGVESQYDYINQLYGGTYWDMTDESTGITNREAAMNTAMATAIYNEVMYSEALAKNYSLTEDEEKTIATDVDTMLSDEANKDLIKHNNFTKRYLTDIVSRTTLVARYRQDIVDSLPIDDENIKKGFNKDELRQYDIEYLYVSTKKTDDEGNSVDLSDAEKTAAYDKLNALYETAKTTEDWSTLVPEEEKDVVYQKDDFIESDTKFADEFEAKIMAMENKAITEISETEDGYYIIRMLNNNSTAAYDSAVEEAITEAENTAFNQEYDEILVNHEYKINEKELNNYTMGEITLGY